MNILALIWLFLPAGIANMAPIFASKIPWLKTLDFPMDFYVQYRGKRLLGDHKTIRGLISGILLGIATVYVQKQLFLSSEFIQTVSLLHYPTQSALTLGTLLGAGALIGDAVESFFKRQLDIESGKSWFPYDQIDYIVGAAIFIFPLIALSIVEYTQTILIFFILHILVTYVGFQLKLKKDPI
ncbi:MAG: CDP-archaeol synthase [Microgenomates group bacterium]